MATTKTIHTVIKVRRGTTEEWVLNKDIVPAAGEPCLDKTTGRVVYGDGTKTYEQLVEQAKKQDSLALKLQESGGLTRDEEGNIGLKGYDSANQGQFPAKGPDGLVWRDVYTKAEVDAKVTSVFYYKGTVADKTELETKKAESKQGDTYYVTDEDEFYIYNGTEFESFGSATNFATKEEFEALKDEVLADEGRMIETIKAAGRELPIIDKVVDIPIAKTGAPGLVKPTDKENGITIDENGIPWVNNVNVNKLSQTVGDIFIIDGGEAGGNIIGNQEYFDDIINAAIDTLGVVIPKDKATINHVAENAIGITINDTSDEATVNDIYSSLVPPLLSILTSNTNAIKEIKYKEQSLTIDGNIQFTAIENLFKDLQIYKITKLKELIGKTITFKIVTTEKQEYEYTVNFLSPVGKYSIGIPDTEHLFGDTIKASDMQGNIRISWSGNKGTVSGIAKVYTMSGYFDNARGHYIGLSILGNDNKTVTASQIDFAKNVASTSDWIIKLDGLTGTIKFTADDIELCELDFSKIELNHLTGETAFVTEQNHGTHGDPAAMYSDLQKTWKNTKCTVTGTINKILKTTYADIPEDGHYFGFTLDRFFIGHKLSVRNPAHSDTDIESATENELDWVIQIKESNKQNGIFVYADDKTIAYFDLTDVTLGE